MEKLMDTGEERDTTRRSRLLAPAIIASPHEDIYLYIYIYLSIYIYILFYTRSSLNCGPRPQPTHSVLEPPDCCCTVMRSTSYLVPPNNTLFGGKMYRVWNPASTWRFVSL